MRQDQTSYGPSFFQAEDAHGDISNKQNIRLQRMSTGPPKPIAEQFSNVLGLDLDGSEQVASDEDEDEYQDMDDTYLSNTVLRQYRLQSKAAKARQSKSSLPSSTTLLDEPDEFGYGELGYLDASIQPRGRMRRRLLKLEGITPDFESSMQSAWQQDRAKKKQRKQAREDLRQLGLLDHKGRANLKSRYVEGLSIGDIEEEVKIFLQSSRER